MRLREELIQVAAVAVAIVTDMDEGGTGIYQSMSGSTPMNDVWSERWRQEQRWGEQHHPIAEWLAILGEEYGEACKAANDEVIFPK